MPLADFTTSLKKTGTTGTTVSVSNEMFIRAVFGGLSPGVQPMLVSFMGNPQRVSSKDWFGQSWASCVNLGSDLHADANNYFSLAVYRPNESGEFQRLKKLFHALHAIMLDDIGTKADMSRLTPLPPSWLLETSPGNYQAGYLLRSPLVDANEADRLMKAIINAGLTDAGAGGPCARLARLPVAVNGKYVPPFSCHLARWEPELRYSVRELVDGFQLDTETVERPKRQRAQGSQMPPVDGEVVWLPGPAENPVLVKLRKDGLYKSMLGDGKHDITCPWVDAHTDSVDSGTAYFERDEDWPIGGFKCMHGHCAGRNIRDLMQVLNIEFGAARMQPTIRGVQGEIHRVVEAAQLALMQSSRHYQRGGRIVTVVTDPGTRETRVQEVSLHGLIQALASVATWEVFNMKVEDWRRVDPPNKYAAALHDAGSYKHLPVLKGLARQPYIRPDGSLMMTAGYDQATGLFGVFNANEFTVPEKPSHNDAKVALSLLEEIVTEFTFSSEFDRAATLAAILTAASRASLSLAPMYHVCAPISGSGKSYLCRLITAFATPQCSTPTTFPVDDEECRKLLLAELLNAPAVIEFDNLTSDLLPHKSLCTVLTSEFLTGRILGVSKMAAASTSALFLSSGNNVLPVQDMARRCITIRLDPNEEIPITRKFKRPDLVSELLRDRGRYVSAALTVIRGWIAAGRPKIECQSLASFGEWSDLCRQPLMWLGCADPAQSVFEGVREDPDRELLARILAAWHSVFGKVPTMVREAIKQTGNHTELSDVLHDIAAKRGEINGRILGWWIKRHAGQAVGGLRFIRTNSSGSAEKWGIETVSPVSPVSSEQRQKISADAYRRASSGD